MKTKHIINTFTILSTLFIINSCKEPPTVSTEELIDLKSTSLAADPQLTGTLTTEQEDDLRFIYEEEKMARDVYYYFINELEYTAFTSIMNSEQNHMDAVNALLIKYGVEHNVSDSHGVFVDEFLGNLYNTLTENGESSISAALMSGVTIEDFDIDDLTETVANFSNTDIVNVITNLISGSENHLRYFISVLLLLDENYTYEPVFIEEADYERIISTPIGHYGNSENN